MPIFQYICETCGKKEDRLVKRTEETTQVCTCDDKTILVREDILSAPGHQYKGRWFKNAGSY